ncbi:hypothetical protein PENSPDRAFT_607078 [Peniophora sp. CONT]|nr:hypothetical protein PENSPDRAFT_607078 [Peniophora sp. CONT]
MAEARERQLARFGEVLPIGRDDYTREITEASKVDEAGDEKGRGTGVVALLYKDGIPRSDRTFEHIRGLARKHPRTKFVSIVGDKCIPNLPDGRVPMFIVYRKGDIVTQITAWGADKDRSSEELEAVLIMSGAIDPPTHAPEREKRDSEDEDESEDEGGDKSSGMRSRGAFVNHTTKNVRGPAKNADDSDSDFDL